MDFSPKILLTIIMEGGTLEKGEPEVRKYYLTKKDMFPSQKFKGNEGDKVIKSGKYKYTPTVSKDAIRKISLCESAYDYMTSPSCPEWYHNIKEWKKMSPIQRLEMHLARTCRHYGGKSYQYKIIDEQ